MPRIRYLIDNQPGISRRKRGKGFLYFTAAGDPIRAEAELLRIRALAIPPAWTGVWISPIAHGHLQATGRDARGRKQYLYHPDWRQEREQTKFDRLPAFARFLPRLRRRIRADLARPGLGRRKILAAVCSLLDRTLVRVGNSEYAEQNGSYGLTTLRNRHAKVRGSAIEFSFPGKSGKRHAIHLDDARLARIVKRCQDLPGQELFEYFDPAGRRHDVGSHDVNRYLRQVSREDFSAKDFRTWHGTVQTVRALRQLPPTRSVRTARRNLVAAIKLVAQALGNTPAVCRKSYIHPAVFEVYLDHHLSLIRPKKIAGLRLDEQIACAVIGRTGLPKRESRQVARIDSSVLEASNPASGTK